MENQQLIYSKIDIENILIYIKKSKKFIVVSENIFLLIKNYLSRSKKLFLEYLKKYHKKSNSRKIISELDNLLSFEENEKLNYNIKPPSNLKSKFKFSLKNNYLLLHDNSINLNDIIGQLFHLSNDYNGGFKTFKVFKRKTNYFLFFNDEIIGYWDVESIHMLKGKIISILICDHHDLAEEDWAGFLHGSMVSKKNKSYLIIGSSGSGKTSLATQMVKNGYSLICDDTAPLNKNKAFGNFPNALSIKESHTNIFKKHLFNDFLAYSTNTFKGPITYLYPKKQKVVSKFFKCNIILKIKYKDDCQFRLKNPSKFQILNEFINDSFIPRNDLSVKAFINWFNHCQFYEIEYSKSKDLLNFINNI